MCGSYGGIIDLSGGSSIGLWVLCGKIVRDVERLGVWIESLHRGIGLQLACRDRLCWFRNSWTNLGRGRQSLLLWPGILTMKHVLKKGADAANFS